MKPMRKILVLVSVFVFATGCVGAGGPIYDSLTGPVTSEITNVKRGGDAGSLANYNDHIDSNGSMLNYSDDLVEFGFPRKSNKYYHVLSVKNNSSETIYIDWNDVEVVNTAGNKYNVLKDGVITKNLNEADNPREAIDPGQKEMHAFIPNNQTRPEGGGGYQDQEFAFICKGKVYTFDITSMDIVEGGFERPDTCSEIKDTNVKLIQIGGGNPGGQDYSLIVPATVGNKTAEYKFDFSMTSVDN